MKAKNAIGKIYVRASPPTPPLLEDRGTEVTFFSPVFLPNWGAGFQPAVAACCL